MKKSKGTLLAIVLVSTLAVFPTLLQVHLSPEHGPHADYLHIINYGDPYTEFAALEACEIDITDWPLSNYWINKWVGEGRVPGQIGLNPYAAIDAFEYDVYNQKWPTGCDGVAAREGYAGTFTRGVYTWNQYHTRQRPETSPGMHPPTYDPGTQTTPMGDGADYDPETSSWKTYFDEDCLWCTMAWGLRLAIAFTTDKDYIVSTILEGLGEKMITKAAAPAHHGYLDVANLTSSSFVYHGPHADVTIPSLVFGHGMTRAQMDAKAEELLDAAGFIKYGGNTWRSDPRKVAGADKQYGTGDDVTGAATEMDGLIFYIRLDDPHRVAAGQKLTVDLEAIYVPIDDRIVAKAVCFKNVKVDYDYHLYTAGWVLSPDPDYLYHLFHSSMYWYPVGWSSNYPGFCHTNADKHLYDVKHGTTLAQILNGFHNSTFLINKYVASIPLWSSASAKAYKTGWKGTVNMAGEGKDNFWSFFNMRKLGTNTINWGFCNSPETLNVIIAEWKWDRKVLGLVYESLITRNPYNLAELTGILATSWSTGTWDGDKAYVDFNLKSGVKWHDGTLFTAEDVKWALEFIRDCGFGVAWTHPVENGGTYLETCNLKDLHNVTVTAPGAGGSVRVYFSSNSYWAVHWAGLPLLPSRKIWMNASAHYGWGYDPSKPPGIGPGKRWPSDAQRMMVRNYDIYDDDIYDPTSATPQADGIVDLVQDGTGPWKFVGYTGPMGAVQFIDLEAFRDHHLSQSGVEAYLNNAFHKLGNVNYPGSVHEADYIAAGFGIDQVIDAVDLTLINRAYLTTPADPPGIDWGEWNVDCDFNNDNVIDSLDYAIATLNLYRSANGAGPPPPPPPPMYWKANYTDYAQSGLPDFDQKQDLWQKGAFWTWCAPTAVANSLWWMDSRFETSTTPPPTINSTFGLVPTWWTAPIPPPQQQYDDHDPRHVQPFIQHLAYLMDTDGQRTNHPSTAHSGTWTWDMQTGIAQYLSWTGVNPEGDVNGDGVVNMTDYNIVLAANGTSPGQPGWDMDADVWPASHFPTPWIAGTWPMADNVVNASDLALVTANMNSTGMFYEKTMYKPDFYEVEAEVERSEDVVLVLGFWYNPAPEVWIRADYPDTPYDRVGLGHAVTVAGINSSALKIAISDPGIDAFEAGGPGRSPVRHAAHSGNSTTHNNASLVSHDIYNVTFIGGNPNGTWALQGYVGNPQAGAPPGAIAVVEAAVIVSPREEVGGHDVAVTDVAPHKTIVCQGYNCRINVTVTNEGNFTETFNVTAYANTTAIQTLNVTNLPSGSSITITFLWNTAGFPKGVYTISADATIVAGETDTGDNSFTDGTVRVVMVGDVNGDGKVTITDIVIIALCFGCKRGDPCYNPNADINCDGKCTITDVVIAALHFGETDP